MDKSVCDAFSKNSDGSWTSIRPVNIINDDGYEVKISQGIVFTKGMLLVGRSWLNWLNEHSVL